MEWSLLSSVVKLIIAVPIILVVIYIVLKLINKYSYKAHGKHIEIIEKVGVQQKSSIHIAKVCGTYMLIGATEDKVDLLKELNEEEVETLLKEEAEAKKRSSSIAGGDMTFKEAFKYNFSQIWRRNK
jgi:flagellar biogenesis protein FliO